jgi:hypothetical protein
LNINFIKFQTLSPGFNWLSINPCVGELIWYCLTPAAQAAAGVAYELIAGPTVADVDEYNLVCVSVVPD